MIRIVARSSISIIAAFCIISVIAISSLKISLISFNNDDARTHSLLHFMAIENHSLYSVLPTTDQSFTRDVLQLLTNLNLKDMQTFLVSEIPGLSASSPKILIAAEGTNFTNLPIESPPPPDFGIWEEAVDDGNEEQLKEEMVTKDFAAFIYHSHNRESFLPLLPGVTNPNHASSKDKNITMLGERLGQKLEERGIKTLVDKSDIPAILAKRNLNYYQSYAVAREVVVDAMAHNREVELIFDIHRDAARKNVTTATIDGVEYAKILFVVGTSHSQYAKNIEFAGKLNSILEKKYPGLSRGAIEKSKKDGDGIYNQDLSHHSMVIEIGGVDNNLDELNRTVDILAEVISEYYWGEAVQVNN